MALCRLRTGKRPLGAPRRMRRTGRCRAGDLLLISALAGAGMRAGSTSRTDRFSSDCCRLQGWWRLAAKGGSHHEKARTAGLLFQQNRRKRGDRQGGLGGSGADRRGDGDSQPAASAALPRRMVMFGLIGRQEGQNPGRRGDGEASVQLRGEYGATPELRWAGYRSGLSGVVVFEGQACPGTTASPRVQWHPGTRAMNCHYPLSLVPPGAIVEERETTAAGARRHAAARFGPPAAS